MLDSQGFVLWTIAKFWQGEARTREAFLVQYEKLRNEAIAAGRGGGRLPDRQIFGDWLKKPEATFGRLARSKTPSRRK